MYLRRTQYLDGVAQNLQNPSMLHKLKEDCEKWENKAEIAEGRLQNLKTQVKAAQAAVGIISEQRKK